MWWKEKSGSPKSWHTTDTYSNTKKSIYERNKFTCKGNSFKNTQTKKNHLLKLKLTFTHRRFLIILVFGNGIISWLLNFTLPFFNSIAVKYPSSLPSDIYGKEFRRGQEYLHFTTNSPTVTRSNIIWTGSNPWDSIWSRWTKWMLLCPLSKFNQTHKWYLNKNGIG